MSKFLVSKKKCFSNVDYVAFYTVLYNGMVILARIFIILYIIEKIRFVSQKAQNNVG